MPADIRKLTVLGFYIHRLLPVKNIAIAPYSACIQFLALGMLEVFQEETGHTVPDVHDSALLAKRKR